MCERSEKEVVPISGLFNCSAEFELPKIWIRKRTFAMWLRFRIASHKITPVYGRSFNNTAALNGQLKQHLLKAEQRRFYYVHDSLETRLLFIKINHAVLQVPRGWLFLK